MEAKTNAEFKEEPKKKSGVLKYTIYIILVIVITIAAIIISMWGKFDIVFNLLAGANFTWLLVTLLVMFVSVLLRALILFVFARLYSRDYKYHQALAVESIGNFYSAVTPGASGGQVMEAYTFQKQGLPISNAVSMLAMYSIVFQIVLTVFGLVSFIIKFDFLNSIGYITIDIGAFKLNVSIWVLTIIGFLLNVSVTLLVFLMSYWKGFHNFIMGPVISIAYKLHIVRDKDKARDNLRIQIENFKIELRRLFTNAPFTILVTLLFILMLFVRFSLPFFCGKVLYNESTNANIWDSVFLSNYHQMVTGLIPLPGSAGISEYFFLELFVNTSHPEQGFFYKSGADAATASSALGSAALLIWRTISFTLPLLIAGFVTAFYRTRGKHSVRFNDKEVYENRKTMIEMKRETMLERETELNDMIHTQNLTREAIKKKIDVFHKKGEKIKDPMRDNDEIREIDISKDDD
ncbi:MAG: flippase-like domain-containing protein [Bacilli bacterium]|nr:flippase-like domain-containing protein [Bacilli bacterium]